MMTFLPDNLSDVFAVETPLLELVVRGSVLYLTILILMRLMPRRTGGELATMDLIFVILVADAASNGFGEYTSVTEGLVVVIVLMTWNFLVNAASYRFRFIETIVSAPPIQIVRDGKLLKRNMRREFLTEEELMSYLRQESISRLDQVKAAYIEGEGAITVVKNQE